MILLSDVHERTFLLLLVVEMMARRIDGVVEAK